MVTNPGEYYLTRRKDQVRNPGIRDPVYGSGKPFLVEFAIEAVA